MSPPAFSYKYRGRKPTRCSVVAETPRDAPCFESWLCMTVHGGNLIVVIVVRVFDSTSKGSKGQTHTQYFISGDEKSKASTGLMWEGCPLYRKFRILVNKLFLLLLLSTILKTASNPSSATHISKVEEVRRWIARFIEINITKLTGNNKRFKVCQARKYNKV